MNNTYLKQDITKTSYYCQSIYTSINLFMELTDNRNYEILNDLLMKIIDDISCCINFYSNLSLDMSPVYEINKSLNSLVDGYKNWDYFYIRDILEYDTQKNIETIFENTKCKIANVTN